MIETVMTAQMPVGLPIKIKKNRLEPDYIREDMPRLSMLPGFMEMNYRDSISVMS